MRQWLQLYLFGRWAYPKRSMCYRSSNDGLNRRAAMQSLIVLLPRRRGCTDFAHGASTKLQIVTLDFQCAQWSLLLVDRHADRTIFL